MNPTRRELPLSVTLIFWLTIWSVIALALWYFVGGLPRQWHGSLSDAGTFGDSYGYVNSLFSGLAFGGVIVAIILQTIELRHQRQEMQESQRSWETTATAQQASQQSLKDQADSLFLAAYLHALVAVRDSPPLESLSENQRESLDQIEGAVDRLQQRADNLLGTPRERLPIRKRMAARIEQIARVGRIEWAAKRQDFDPIAFAASKDVLERCRSEFRRLLPDFDDYFGIEASKIIEKANRLFLQKISDTGVVSDTAPAYQTYWKYGEELFGDLRTLAVRLGAAPTAATG